MIRRIDFKKLHRNAKSVILMTFEAAQPF